MIEKIEKGQRMKLYMVPAAPNHKVMLYIAERAALGFDLGIEQIVVNTLKGRQKEPEHLARNPFGALPVLERMMELSDRSLTIIDYLEEAFPDGALVGGDADSRANAKQLERIVELKVFNPMTQYVHATNSPLGLPPNEKQARKLKIPFPLL